MSSVLHERELVTSQEGRIAVVYQISFLILLDLPFEHLLTGATVHYVRYVLQKVWVHKEGKYRPIVPVDDQDTQRLKVFSCLDQQ